MRLLDGGDCGFESLRRHGYMFLVSVVCREVEVSESSREVLPSVVCLSVTVKSRKRGGPSPLKGVVT
jgi:hypothetical protein